MVNKTSPLVKASIGALKNKPADPLEAAPGKEVTKWARGEASLSEVKGYAEEELYSIAQHGYALFLNGKFQDAQTVFEGLVALDPRNDYYYRALGVVYHRRGDAERALRQFTHALKVAPRSVAAYVNRAEVHISRREIDRALEDLDQAIRVGRDPADPQSKKALALRSLLRGVR